METIEHLSMIIYLSSDTAQIITSQLSTVVGLQ